MDAHYAIEIKAPCFRQGRRDRGVSFAPRRFAAERRSSSATIRPTKAVSPSSPRAEAAPIQSAARGRARSAPSRSRERCASGSPNSPIAGTAHERGHCRPRSQNLDLALIGNSCAAAFVDQNARIVWWCFPYFDSDPVFSRLLAGDEEKGILRRHARRPARDRVALRAQHGDRRDDPHRREWRQGADLRFRAKFRAIRARSTGRRKSSAASNRSPACRASPSGCARPTITAVRRPISSSAPITFAIWMGRRFCA